MEENQHMKLLRKRKHLHGLVGLALVLEDVFIVMEEVHTSHALITNCDVLKYEAVDQSIPQRSSGSSSTTPRAAMVTFWRSQVG